MKQVLIIMAFFFAGLSTIQAQQGRLDDYEAAPPPPPPPPPHEDMRRGPKGEFPGKLDHEERMEEILSRLQQEANLTKAQSEKIRGILEQTTKQIKAQEAQMKPQMEEMRKQFEQLKASGASRDEIREQMHELKEQFTPDMQEFKESLRQIRLDSKKQINDVLTTEQKAKLYETMSEKRMDDQPKYKNKTKERNK